MLEPHFQAALLCLGTTAERLPVAMDCVLGLAGSDKGPGSPCGIAADTQESPHRPMHTTR
jgi:hypothetical protein